MTYEETLHYLYTQTPAFQQVGAAAYKPGLDNSLQLDAIFGKPHTRFNTIHVAGTNGKGSVSHLLAAILQRSGYRTGLYTSPHLVDFRERIRVNGEMIPQSYVVEFVEKYRDEFEPIMPSFFELTMEMAFLYFAEQTVDVAVIETGLGGRLDSTNIISPDLCVVTNIGLDHTQFLGDTLPKIAAEKAGIIKPHTPVVIGEGANTEVAQVFIDKVQSVDAPLLFAERYMTNFSAERGEASGWLFHADGYPRIKGELKGLAQDKNARTVLMAVEILLERGYTIPKEAVCDGFANVTAITGFTGRWQQLQASPRIICDIAHNAHGMRYVAAQLHAENFNRLHIVLGMANDKDLDTVLSLLPREAIYYFTKASVARALDEETLARQARIYGLQGNSYKSVAEAVNSAKENADKEDLLFIGGSAFVVADALPLFG